MTQTVAGQFRQYWVPILQPYADKAGIPVDYLVTQLGHESMWGTITPQGSNNYAGIHEFRKGRDGVMASDAGNLRKFRKYDNDDAFAKDYVGLMARLYPGTKGAKDFGTFANALQNGKGGRRWAESPTYIQDLNTVYNEAVAPLNGQANTATAVQTTPVESAFNGTSPEHAGYMFTGKEDTQKVINPYEKLYTQQIKPVDTPALPQYKSEFRDGYQTRGVDNSFYNMWGIK